MNTDYIRKIADRVMDRAETDWNMDIEHFDWVPGVGLWGIYNAYKKTNDKKYLDFLIGWADRHLGEAYDHITVNSIAPMLTIINLYCETGREDFLKVCLDLADYAVLKAPLTTDGCLEHTVTEPVPALKNQLWADTLFMVCIFLAKLGAVTGKEIYTDFAIKQLKLHHKFLSDGEGLYFHGYNANLKNHMSGIKWGRANAWILYSTMMILNLTGGFDGCGEIYDFVRAHINRLDKVQSSGGAFRTILDDESSYIEISATSGLIAGVKMAVESGIADKEYMRIYDKGVKSIIASIEEDGSVKNVSTGTPVMKDAQAYKDIPCDMPTLYGQGLSIIAL